MKLIKLRFVTLALLLVLSVNAAYAGGGVGNQPWRHQKGDNNPNGMAPNRDTDVDTRKNPVAVPGIPTDANNAGPAVVQDDDDAPAHPNRLPPPPPPPKDNPAQAVPAAGQKGAPAHPNQDDAPGNPDDKKRARRVLKDAAVPAAGQKGAPAHPNRLPPPPPKGNPAQAVPAAGQNVGSPPHVPRRVLKDAAVPAAGQNAGGVYVKFTLPTSPPQNDKDKVFKDPLVPPFDPNTNPTIRYVGQMTTVDRLLYPSSNSGKIQYYDADNKVVEEDIGALIGGGANSQVYYNSNNPNFVNKVVSLNGGYAAKRAVVIMDQNGGRVILNNIKMVTQSKLFTVAQQKEDKQEVITYQEENSNDEYRFLITREENIASEVKTLEGNPVKDLNNNTKTASNAYERVLIRNQLLNKAESLTINLVIRDLNDRGIVWTDLKLANLDIVKDEESPTGYRVIFFDFDGFRPLKGEDPAKRAAAARDIQKAFDAPRLGNSTDANWSVMSTGVKNAIRKHYESDQNKKLDQIKVDEAFDFTAFNNMAISTLATPSANGEIGMYIIYSVMDEKSFIAEVAKFNNENKRTVTYKPANLKP